MSSEAAELEITQARSEEAECPSCGGSFQFNPATRNLKCPYCEFESDIADPADGEEQIVQEMDFSEAANLNGYDWGTDKKSVICGSCAGESIYDSLQIADVCPYCDSNQLMEATIDNALSPNGVIPFGITTNQAADKFGAWLKRRWFTPRAAKENTRPDSFRGVYLPHWTFDSKTASRYTAKYGKDRVVKGADGKDKTVTDWYVTQGFYQEFIDDHLVLATTRHDERMLSKIRPFDQTKSKVYDKQYLAGYVAERYSVGIEDGWKQAQKEIHDHLVSRVTSDIERKHSSNHVKDVKLAVSHSDIMYKYLMLPIWLSSFKYKGKLYQFAVNGQTGKVGGTAPLSALRVAIATAAAIIIISALVWLSYKI
ncbi:hypothetical protein PAECIP111893_02356 [Paenibacillus plantiphilus]|uniref:Replication restart DNA helicase PriA n=1 Tax=Paenibacillus plantiphilus TaxID=2905650 RepID=A0ABN8GCD8_9BACL|nr:hypothetical protein [Paenibacillus plantiphilus]CAH1205475.1 hypothetical protein PAECIP111893_02356 [Paenibacillus plantiphilus]